MSVGIKPLFNLHIFFLPWKARNAGNKETIRRGALMKMLQNSAQTLPLWVGKPGEKLPPLCGAVPADASYIAKVNGYFCFNRCACEELGTLREVFCTCNVENVFLE